MLLLFLLLALLLRLGIGSRPRAAARLLVPSGRLLWRGATGPLLLVCEVLQHLLRLLRPGCRSVREHAGEARLVVSAAGLQKDTMLPWPADTMSMAHDSLLPEAAGGVLEPVDLVLELWVAAVLAQRKHVCLGHAPLMQSAAHYNFGASSMKHEQLE